MQTDVKKIIIFIAAFLLVYCASAQHLVKGSLADAQNIQPLIYVNCVLLKAQDSTFAYGTTSDDKGNFVFKQVPEGDYLLRVSYVGYQTYWQPLTVDANKELGRIEISKGSTALTAVKVTAQKPLYAVDGEKQLYNVTEDPSVQTGTMSDVLQNAPGVEVDAEGNITLRGTQSVEIWINDRPSHMNEEALKQYIKQLPANTIDRVEVITNPSARYSSKGAVINIVTNQKVKRNELLCVGVNATTTPAVAPWVSYVWANEKVDFNFYLSGNYGNHDMASDGTSTLFDNNGDTSRFQKWDNKNKMPFWGGYAGFNVNWNIDSMTHLSAWAGAYPYWDRNSFYNNYQYFEYDNVNSTRTDLGYLDTTLNNGFSTGGYAGAWFEHRFDTTGRKLSVTFNGNIWANGGYSDTWRDYADPSLTDFHRHMTGKSTYGPSMSFGTNYTMPMKHNFELEAGLEADFGGGYEYEKMGKYVSGSYDEERLRSYESEERGTDLNGYVTLQKRWGGFTAKLGVRGEQEWKNSTYKYLDGSGLTTVDTFFFGLVPSIHLSYQTQTFTSYSFSYTLRHSAPGSSQLSPFRRFADFNYETGNPNLLMSYTHNLEVAFNKYVMGFGNIGINAYWRANTNEIGTMTYAGLAPEYFDSVLVNYTQPENIGSSHTEGIEANITYRPSAFFNIRFNASLFNYGYDYNDFSDSKVSYSFRINLWAKLWKRLEVFATGSYSSPRLGLYSLTNANKRFDFGCSSDFFDRKMSVFLNVSDIFGWSEWGSNTTAPQYQTTGSNRFNSRFVSLGLTFRFGKMELESKARQGEAQGPVNLGR